MNLKLVFVWAIAIILFAGIGVFGWYNQGLLLEPDEQPYSPVDNAEKKNICSNSLNNGEISYNFVIDEKTASITKVVITYHQLVESLLDYETANKIVNANVSGATAAISGGVSDFVLILTVTINGYDVAGIEALNADLLKLGMVVDNITDYNTYKTAINNTASNPYTCD